MEGNVGGTGTSDGAGQAGGATGTPATGDFAAWTPEQIRAWGEVQKIRGGEDKEDRKLVFRQLHMSLILILGGAIIATLGILIVNENDTTKLTAIISVGTIVIGAGAALLPTGAASGAAARILSRPVIQDQTNTTPATGGAAPSNEGREEGREGPG
jgi:hypothetical protein